MKCEASALSAAKKYSKAGCRGAKKPETTAKHESYPIPVDALASVPMGIFCLQGYVRLLGAYV